MTHSPKNRTLAAALLLTATPLAISSAKAATMSYEFASTGMDQPFTVPDGVTGINFTVLGARGGAGPNSDGGFGHVVTGTFAVTAGQELTLTVGGAGGVADFNSTVGGAAASVVAEGHHKAVAVAVALVRHFLPRSYPTPQGVWLEGLPSLILSKKNNSKQKSTKMLCFCQ